MKDLLNEKRIVITGGSDGLGKALGLKCVQRNANVVILSRDSVKLDNVIKDFQDKGYTVKGYVCNISDSEAVDYTFSKILEELGDIDFLINNAGIWQEGSLVEINYEDIAKVFDVNILGLIYATKAVLPEMIKRGTGYILNISSYVALYPIKNCSVYLASKLAIKGFSDALELDLMGTGVVVNCVYPDAMYTNIFNSAGINKGRQSWMMTPEDVAEAIINSISINDSLLLKNLVIKKI